MLTGGGGRYPSRYDGESSSAAPSDHFVDLRAERSGSGDRVYTISVVDEDGDCEGRPPEGQ